MEALLIVVALAVAGSCWCAASAAAAPLRRRRRARCRPGRGPIEVGPPVPSLATVVARPLPLHIFTGPPARVHRAPCRRRGRRRVPARADPRRRRALGLRHAGADRDDGGRGPDRDAGRALGRAGRPLLGRQPGRALMAADRRPSSIPTWSSGSRLAPTSARSSWPTDGSAAATTPTSRASRTPGGACARSTPPTRCSAIGSGGWATIAAGSVREPSAVAWAAARRVWRESARAPPVRPAPQARVRVSPGALDFGFIARGQVAARTRPPAQRGWRAGADSRRLAGRRPRGGRPGRGRADRHGRPARPARLLGRAPAPRRPGSTASSSCVDRDGATRVPAGAILRRDAAAAAWWNPFARRVG